MRGRVGGLYEYGNHKFSVQPTNVRTAFPRRDCTNGVVISGGDGDYRAFIAGYASQGICAPKGRKQQTIGTIHLFTHLQYLRDSASYLLDMVSEKRKINQTFNLLFIRTHGIARIAKI